jgi:hypothetical protein
VRAIKLSVSTAFFILSATSRILALAAKPALRTLSMASRCRCFAAFAAALTLSFAAFILTLASYLASSMLSLWARIFFSILSFTAWIRIFTLSDSAVMSAFSNRSRFLPVTTVFEAVSAN